MKLFDTPLQKASRWRLKHSFGQTAALEPVSRIFGLDRGTPIDRFYIERFLAHHAGLIHGEVLEVGSDLYTVRFGGAKVTKSYVLDIKGDDADGRTIAGDLTDHGTIPAGRMDCFICTQTFNFIYDTPKAVQGAFNLLKPGGTLLATVAGISQISRYDMERWGDYWRFTTASLQRLFEPVFGAGTVVASHGNLPASLALLQGLALEDLPDVSLLEAADPDYQMLLTVVAQKGGQ
jgi:hypothetical protein